MASFQVTSPDKHTLNSRGELTVQAARTDSATWQQQQLYAWMHTPTFQQGSMYSWGELVACARTALNNLHGKK